MREVAISRLAIYIVTLYYTGKLYIGQYIQVMRLMPSYAASYLDKCLHVYIIILSRFVYVYNLRGIEISPGSSGASNRKVRRHQLRNKKLLRTSNAFNTKVIKNAPKLTINFANILHEVYIA